MKDILKMSTKERTIYLSHIDVDKEIEKAKDFSLKRDNYYVYPISQLVRQNHKLFFGHIRQPKTDNEKFNYLMIYLSIFITNGLFNEYIKESELE